MKTYNRCFSLGFVLAGLLHGFSQQPGTKLWEFVTSDDFTGAVSSPAIGPDATIYLTGRSGFVDWDGVLFMAILFLIAAVRPAWHWLDAKRDARYLRKRSTCDPDSPYPHPFWPRVAPCGSDFYRRPLQDPESERSRYDHEGFPLMPSDDQRMVGRFLNRRRLHTHFEVLLSFATGEDHDKRGFALNHVHLFPQAIEMIFVEIQSIERLAHGSPPDTTRMIRRRNKIIRLIDLMVRLDQYRVAHFLCRTIHDSPFVFRWDKDEAIRFLQDGQASPAHMPSIYASILLALDTRPLFSFLNEYDLLQKETRDQLQPAIFEIISRRISAPAKLLEVFDNKPIWDGEIVWPHGVERLVRERKSLLEAILGKDAHKRLWDRDTS